jgi:hypothetical protein
MDNAAGSTLSAASRRLQLMCIAFKIFIRAIARKLLP